MKKNVNLLTVAIIGIAIMTSMASAAIIAPVDCVEPPAPFGPYLGGINGADYHTMINGSGLHDTNMNGILGDADDLVDVDPVDWVTKEFQGLPGCFYGYSLGGVYDITKILFWNGTTAGKGLTSTVWGFSGPEAVNGWQGWFQSPMDAPGIGVADVWTVNFQKADTIWFWGYAGIGGGETSIAEVRFEGTPSIPEPATIGLLGMGVLGLIRRRKA